MEYNITLSEFKQKIGNIKYIEKPFGKNMVILNSDVNININNLCPYKQELNGGIIFSTKKNKPQTVLCWGFPKIYNLNVDNNNNNCISPAYFKVLKDTSIYNECVVNFEGGYFQAFLDGDVNMIWNYNNSQYDTLYINFYMKNYLKTIKKYCIEIMKKYNVCITFKYNIKICKMFVIHMRNVKTGRYLSHNEMVYICEIFDKDKLVFYFTHVSKKLKFKEKHILYCTSKIDFKNFIIRFTLKNKQNIFISIDKEYKF
jgi:hypothetical protein